MSKRQRRRLGLLLSVALGLFLTSPTFADTLVSPHYQFSESTLGANGLPSSASTDYQGSSSIGDIGVGFSGSTHFGFQGGSQTTADPRLAVAITSPTAAFPTFDPTTPAMATATFQVLNYTSYGYSVFVTGGAPTNHTAGGPHTIQPMATQGASTPGFEQFGINLVANTSPQNIGANPDNGTYGWAYGAAGDVNNLPNLNYKTANQYVYNDGDLIASANKSGGYTNYTITYLLNVAELTPGGQYSTNESIIVVGTY